MRRISGLQILTFVTLFLIALALALASTWIALGGVPLGDFRGVVLSVFALIGFYVYGIIVYRLFLRAFPLKAGEIEKASAQEFVYHVYVLFYLLIFYPVMRSGFMPAPLMRLFYLALGAKLGANTYSQGIIHDPGFVEIGRDSVVGQSALLIPHVIEGDRLAHHAIRAGNNVSIGAGSIVLPDVVIGDGAMIAAGAVVAKGTRIGPGEVWAGVPARCISAGNRRSTD